MSDYQRGVEQASAVYQEVIREYVAENEKLRELVRHALTFCVNGYCSEYEGCMWAIGKSGCSFADRAKKLGVVA